MYFCPQTKFVCRLFSGSNGAFKTNIGKVKNYILQLDLVYANFQLSLQLDLVYANIQLSLQLDLVYANFQLSLTSKSWDRSPGGHDNFRVKNLVSLDNF